MSNIYDRRYSINRSNWKKTYGYTGIKPRYTQIVDVHTNVSYSIDINNTIRERGYFEIQQAEGDVISVPYVWDPSSLGLAYWFDSSDTSTLTISTTVSAWANKGTLGGSATNTAATQQPTWSASDLGYPGIRFDGSDDSLSIAGSSFTEAEMYVIFQINAWPGNAGAVYTYGTAGASNHHPYFDGLVYDGFATNLRKDGISVTAGTFTSPTLMNILSAPSNYVMRINGTQIYSNAVNVVSNGTTLFLGKGFSIPLAGVIREFGVRGTAFTANERTQLYEYVKQKWGVP